MFFYRQFLLFILGVAEFAFGLWLTLAALFPLLGFEFPALLGTGISDAAAALLALTILVTPANIYMYTHGAKLPVAAPEVPVAGHFIRGLLQIFLFTLFNNLAQPSIEKLLF